MKRANYHTHTARCMHGVGTEREYVEAAVEAGLEVLGFSDHTPQPYKEFVSGIRMAMDELPEYVGNILALREEFKDKIEIKIGFEVEYIPQYFEELMNIFADYPVDYLIMGQHFVDSEIVKNFVSRAFTEEEKLAKYVDQVIEGLKTGVFAYLAHPDLPNFVGDASIYERQMRRLCVACKELQIPLEINRLGYFVERNYPNKEFWKIAAEVGNEVIIGYDAHDPEELKDEETYQKCLAFAREVGVTVNEGFRI